LGADAADGADGVAASDLFAVDNGIYPWPNESIFHIKENSPIGTFVGTVGTGQAGFEYLVLDGAEYISIHPLTGDIRTTCQFDFESRGMFVVKVGAKRIVDKSNIDPVSQLIQLQVADVNEAPRISIDLLEHITRDGVRVVREGGVSSGPYLMGWVRFADIDLGDFVHNIRIQPSAVSHKFRIGTDAAIEVIEDFVESDGPTVSLTVVATDSRGLAGSGTAVVHLQNPQLAELTGAGEEMGEAGEAGEAGGE
jgi:hypothetical protein